jgi:hypothetical protein
VPYVFSSAMAAPARWIHLPGSRPGSTAASQFMRRRRAARLLLCLPLLGLTVAACNDQDVQKVGAAAYAGSVACTPPSPAVPASAAGPADRWSYQPILTNGAGLVLNQIRLGPRLFADQVSTPYLRIFTADRKKHIALLTPDGRDQLDSAVKSRLEGRVTCGTDDQDSVVTANYQVSVHPDSGPDVTVSVTQQYRFSDTLDHRCEASMTAVCKRFWPTVAWSVPPSQSRGLKVSIVQRLRLNPDDARNQASAGGADLVRDALALNAKHLDPFDPSYADYSLDVDDLAGEGHLVKAGAAQVLVNGQVPSDGWENYHQTDRHTVGLPSTTNAGCTECVHVHWSWFAHVKIKHGPEVAEKEARAVANLVACHTATCWSDGQPELRPGSKQTACVGWTTDPPDDKDVDWCHLDNSLKTNLPPNQPPVMIWDTTAAANVPTTTRDGSKVNGDAAWDKLSGRSHGGDGSFFFVPARRLATPTDTGTKSVVATITPVWPARLDTSTFQNGKWVLPIRIQLSDPDDKGPYYLRVRTFRGLNLTNPDGRYDPAAGGAPWVTVHNVSADADGAWRIPQTGYEILSAYPDRPDKAGMVALLAFDKQPDVKQLSLRLDAAPNGTAGYQPSTGQWTMSAAAWKPYLAHCLFENESPDYGMHVDGITYADVNGDGVRDMLVTDSCGSSTSSQPETVEVFDGNSNPDLPQRIGNILLQDDTVYPRQVQVTVNNEVVTVKANGLGPGDVQAGGTWGLTETFRLNGTSFDQTSRKFTQCPNESSCVGAN